MKSLPLILAALLACLPASAQTATQPTVKHVGVYSQKASDLAFWASKGITLAVHWESESGKVTQRQWRAAAKAAKLKYVDAWLEDADADDPDLIGWIIKGSDEWNRARGNPPTRPDPATFVAESIKLATLNRAKGTNKLIMANADGPGVTTALFEKPPYNGIRNNELALLPFLTLRSIDWYPVVAIASTQPAEIARRPMHLPAQAVWRVKTWCDQVGAGPAQYMAIVEAAKNHKAPLGVTPAQMREQVDYLTGARPFPVSDANGKAVNFQGPLIDILVWWTANGQDGPGWKWIASDADQMAALVEITAKVKGVSVPTTNPTTTPTTLPTSPDVAALTAKVDEQAKALRTVQDRQKAFDEWLEIIRNTAPRGPPTTAPSTQPTSRVYYETNVTPIATHPGTDGKLATNPDWIDYAAAKGFTPVQFAYNGTLNRAFTWCDDAGNARPMKVTSGGGDALDWSRQPNACDPPNPIAVRAIARLAKTPATYGYPGPARTLVFDLENTATMNLGPTDSTAARRLMLQRWIDAVKAAKAEGVEVAIWSGPPYFPQMPDTLDLERQLVAELPSIWVETYNHDLTVTPEQWKANVDRLAGVIATAYPGYKGRIVATMCPWWQIYWPQNDAPDVRALEGKPVDLARWAWQVNDIRGRGWDVALWTGGGTMNGVKPYLDAMADATAK